MLGALGPMLAPALKLAVARIRDEVARRGRGPVAEEYAVQLGTMLAQLPEADRALALDILARVTHQAGAPV
jgi:hypothetical protein